MKLKPIAGGPMQVPFHIHNVEIRDTKQGIVAQMKGRKGKGKRTKKQSQFSQRFAFAGRMAANPEAMQYETAVEMSKGTEQVPRDILTMAAMGRYYILKFDNGLTARYCRGPVINDPDNAREPAIYLQTPELPWRGVYLSIGNGRRLLT